MMRILFTGIARRELEDAVRYYELEYSGLGRRIQEEVRKAAVRISEQPQVWSIERGDVRKYLLHTFPYKLMYSVEEGHILVIAVAHQHRNPDYWVGRDKT